MASWPSLYTAGLTRRLTFAHNSHESVPNCDSSQFRRRFPEGSYDALAEDLESPDLSALVLGRVEVDDALPPTDDDDYRPVNYGTTVLYRLRT